MNSNNSNASSTNRRVSTTKRQRTRARTQTPPRRLAPGEKRLPVARARPSSPPREQQQATPTTNTNARSPSRNTAQHTANLLIQLTNYIHNKPGTRRLAPHTHPTGCNLIFQVYKEREILLVRDRLFMNCGLSKTNGVGNRYITDWINQCNYPGSNAHVFCAEDPATRQVRAYVCLKLHDKSMTIDIVCGQEFGNPQRNCKNATVHLMHFIELYAAILGVTRLYLSSVPSAVSYYARLGYVRQLDPCTPRTTDRGVPHTNYRSRFSYHLAQLNRLNALQLRNLAMHNAVFFEGKNDGQLVFMSKCLKRV